MKMKNLAKIVALLVLATLLISTAVARTNTYTKHRCNWASYRYTSQCAANTPCSDGECEVATWQEATNCSYNLFSDCTIWDGRVYVTVNVYSCTENPHSPTGCSCDTSNRLRRYTYWGLGKECMSKAYAFLRPPENIFTVLTRRRAA